MQTMPIKLVLAQCKVGILKSSCIHAIQWVLLTESESNK